MGHFCAFATLAPHYRRPATALTMSLKHVAFRDFMPSSDATTHFRRVKDVALSCQHRQITAWATQVVNWTVLSECDALVHLDGINRPRWVSGPKCYVRARTGSGGNRWKSVQKFIFSMSFGSALKSLEIIQYRGILNINDLSNLFKYFFRKKIISVR